MAQDVVINGTTYPAVESVALTDANGNVTMYYPDAVRYNPQTLTDEQKAQARENIGAVGATAVPNSAAVNADNELVMQRTDGDAVAELFRVALPAGGGETEVTAYNNVPEIPLTQGAQYFFYGSEAGTITVTFSGAKWGAGTNEITLEDASVCKYYMWVQTAENAGSFISIPGTRKYISFNSTVPEVISVSSTCSSFVVIKLG